MALFGTAHLKPITWSVCVLDEAHRLKNKSSKATEILKQYKFDHKVLLTGTPLQNSLEELWSLLNFLEPEQFENENDFKKDFGSMSSAAEVEKLQAILKPLMLRRLKEAIDRFCSKESESFVFLLCTRAGGVGINLTVADTVVIFDSDWNPQNDLQAQSRCHRIGQTKQVQIYRLITRNTYEREMFDKASMKLGLDKAILQRMDTGGADDVTSADTGAKTLSQLPKNEIEDLLKKGAYGAFMDDDSSKQFCEEDIDQILERRTQVIKHDQTEQKGSIFSKATFAASNADSNIEINDPDFWDKLAQKADLTVIEDTMENLIVMEPRMRRQGQIFIKCDSTSNPIILVQRFGIQDQEADLGPDDEAVRGNTSDGGYRPAPGVDPVKIWSPTEKGRLERALMLYGLGSWDKMLLMFSKRTEQDLKAACRAIIMHIIEHGKPMPDKDLISDMHEVLSKEFDCPVSGSNNDVPYPDASKRQIFEFRSLLIDAPRDYVDHIAKKGSKKFLFLKF
ncbi:choline dehydrogenase 6 [Nowakowskiella sp. JEL0078]|nr:choline dehydrogenase 6 [Nowakowskiella sp. JEL0078]